MGTATRARNSTVETGDELVAIWATMPLSRVIEDVVPPVDAKTSVAMERNLFIAERVELMATKPYARHA